jgi:tetratricopeptide (TPR) repeat protein
MFISASCSIQKIAVRSFSGIMDYGIQSILEESDLRIAEISLASNLKLIETLIKADPENEKLLTMAAMGYGSYALGFLEDTLPDRASNLYNRGKEYGLRVLRKNSDFSVAEKGDLDDFVKSLNNFSKDDVPALFWASYNWGSLINLNVNDMEIMADLPKVNALMQRALDLDDKYYFGGAYLYFASMYSKIPAMLGGKPQKSKEYFERAIKISDGKFLMAYVYYAKMYAVTIQDKELYISLLNKVLEAPMNILPDHILPNVIAKQKAKVLLENIDKYF